MTPNSKFYNFCMTLTDLIVVNVLCVICCIPIFTIGASITATYDCTLKMVRKEETAPIAKGFFKAFRANFKQATLLWLVFLAFGIFLVLDFFLISNNMEEGLARSWGLVLIAFAAVIYVCILAYLFPLISHFENTGIQMVRNSLRLAVGKLLYTIPIVIMDLSPLLILFVPGDYLKWVFALYVFIWFSGVAWLNSNMFRTIFDQLEENAAESEGKNR